MQRADRAGRPSTDPSSERAERASAGVSLEVLYGFGSHGKSLRDAVLFGDSVKRLRVFVFCSLVARKLPRRHCWAIPGAGGGAAAGFQAPAGRRGQDWAESARWQSQQARSASRPRAATLRRRVAGFLFSGRDPSLVLAAPGYHGLRRIAQPLIPGSLPGLQTESVSGLNLRAWTRGQQSACANLAGVLCADQLRISTCRPEVFLQPGFLLFLQRASFS